MSKKLNTMIVLAVKSSKLIKLLKSAKFLKLGVSFVSMAIFAVCHSVAMGIAFGLSLLVLLFIHELGHIIALKKKGFETKLPIFIPFVGAVIFAPKFKDRHTEAYVGYGGPLLGTIAALAFMIPSLFTESKFWITASYIGVILNLFNMIPISPLDGGRITQAAHSKFKYVGFALLLLFTISLGEPGMLIVWMAVIIDLDTMRMKKRMQFTIAIWVLMVVLTLCQVGKNLWINAMDCAIGAMLALPMFVSLISGSNKEKEKRLQEMEEEMRDKRPECTMEQRRNWLIAWICLIVVQLLIIILQTPYLKTGNLPK